MFIPSPALPCMSFKNDYIRLKALTLGYSLPASTVERFGMSGLRIFFQGDNLLTFQSHKGIDPEQSLAGTTNNRSYNQKIFSFGINLDFWKPTKEYSGVSGDYILFVGNDGNRDIDKVIEIGNSLDNMKVKIITSHKIPREKINNNIEVIYGNWNSSALTDETLKSYYENSILTFIPLKESFQPSGQSVCLQSMSLGIPVMITKTKGFWDLDNFNHLENIVFIDNNNINEWQNALASTLKNENLLNKLSKNSIYTVQKYYNQQKFFRSLEELI